MKNIILFALVAIIAFSCGCSQNTSTTGIVPAATTASSLGTLGKTSLTADTAMLSAIGIQAVGKKVNSQSITPTLGGDNWWTATQSVSVGAISYEYTYNFKVWQTGGTLVTDLTILQGLSSSDVEQVYMYSTYDVTTSSTSYALKMGSSKSDPMKAENRNTAQETIDGPITYTGTYNSKTYGITIDYINISISNNYPDGTVTFSTTYDGNSSCSGSIVFNGTNTASFTFTSGASGTYSVNLDTGVATAASL
ncbi:MAG: hypothetical protein HQ564_00505 [Candidatus Saganbacteria bacterium]|nr:hypothetical protein [Candidatus Saganbacteria bacterium]